jgi:PadR family transcriptional regulator, regulatory protein PadR
VKKKKTSSTRSQVGQGKAERYMKPSLLLALREGHARYGYDLLMSIHEYGFVQGKAPPGMVYRHLRQLEEEGFVKSTWQTDDNGPARRIYDITPEGLDALEAWVDFMKHQAACLLSFVARYNLLTSENNATMTSFSSDA